jgi:hypothetical protein
MAHNKTRTLSIEKLENREVLAAGTAAAIQTIVRAQNNAFVEIAEERAELATAVANAVQFNPSGRNPAQLHAAEIADAMATAGRQQALIAIGTSVNIAQAVFNPKAAVRAHNTLIVTALGVIDAKFTAVENKLRTNANVLLAGNWGGTWTYRDPQGTVHRYNLQFAISVSQTGAITATGNGQHPLVLIPGNIYAGDTTFTFTNSPLTFNNATGTLSGNLTGKTPNGEDISLPVSWEFNPGANTLSQASGPIAPSIINKLP